MTETITVLLIFALITLFIVANAITQFKFKQAHERRQLLLKLSALVAETEEILVNSIQLPITTKLTSILLQRMVELLKQILALMPDAKGVQQRLSDTQERLDGMPKNVNDNEKLPTLLIPSNENHIAALIKIIKKIRYILFQEKSNGRLSSKDFINQDKIQGLILVKIFAEYKINQGVAAIAANQLGSARQFLEKALKTLHSQPEGDEYASGKIEEVQTLLKDISADLAAARSNMDEQPNGQPEVGDLEQYFSDTKKKW